MGIVFLIQKAVAEIVLSEFELELAPAQVAINETKPEFDGDYTVVLFGLVKQLKRAPDELGNQIGAALVTKHGALISGYNIIKGFLNLVITDGHWLQFLALHYGDETYGQQPSCGRKVLIEYSSPNTNKPLHLDHLRITFFP